MIAHKSKFYSGLVMMALFVVVFVTIFLPVFGGRNGLQYLDNLYNSISKGSADYIDAVREEVTALDGRSLTLPLRMKSELQAEQTARIFEEAGVEVTHMGAELTVTGPLPRILSHCLDDARRMYANDADALAAKYDYGGKMALYNWWSALKAMDYALKEQKLFAAAKVAERVKNKAVETAYNYYGIEGQKIGERYLVVLFSLVFYVIYTLWYGVGIMHLFEGWGMRLEH